MANLLPTQIPNQSEKFMDARGNNSHNWWLYLYNIGQQVLGNSGTTSSSFSAQVYADADIDIATTDPLTLAERVTNLEKQIEDVFVPTPIQSIVFDDMLVEAVPAAQPVETFTVGTSPWTYVAGFPGTLIVSGGTVSKLELSRDNTHFYTVTGPIPMSRLDRVRVTYSAVPTAVFFPR